VVNSIHTNDVCCVIVKKITD